MLVLTKDSANTIRVSLAELSTLATPVYLIEFISDMSLISTTCIAPDTSLYPARFNQFTITEQVAPNGLLAQILLEPVGFFTYNIYEQTSATNLSPDDPGVILLETGKARVLIDGDRESTAFTYYQNPTPAWAAWDVFESEGIVPAPPSTDATYKNSDASFTQVIAPGVTYIAPDISFTDSDGTVIPTPANTDIVATACPSGGTVFNRPPVTYGRSTSYYTGDDGWQFQNGTYTTGYEQTGNLVQQLDATDLNRETLLYNNQHGTLERFTDGLGGTDWTNAVIGDLTDKRWLTQDHLTGLEWINYDLGTATSGSFPNSTWKLNIANAIAMTIYGYSDYRIAAMHEMNTIIPPQWGVTDQFNNGTYMRQMQISGGTQVHSCSLRTTNRFFSQSAGVITGNGNFNSAGIFVPLILRTMT